MMLRDSMHVTRARQQGFLLPLALFVVIAAASLAVAISQMAGASRSTVLLSALSDQAYYAADAGLEYALVRLHTTARPAKLAEPAMPASAICSDLEGVELQFDELGLKSCQANLQCAESITANAGVIYLLVSAAKCGAGEASSERTLKKTVRM